MSAAAAASSSRRTPVHVHPSFDSPRVLTLTISRPPVNAFDTALWRELRAAFHEVETLGREVRAIVLVSDVDSGFTAGLDLSDPASTNFSKQLADPARTALELRELILDFQDAISSIAAVRIPVVVAVHGVCIGLGLDIISACDVRLCSADAKFSIREAAVAMAADIGTLQRLPRLTGNDSLARELALTGRFFDATTADRLGLVSRVVAGGKSEVREEAMRVAREIAALSPVATLGTKHLLEHARDHTVAEGLAYTALWNSAMLQTDDMAQVVAAFNGGKRAQAPQFKPLRAGARAKL